MAGVFLATFVAELNLMGETFLFGAGEVVVSFVGNGLLLNGKIIQVCTNAPAHYLTQAMLTRCTDVQTHIQTTYHTLLVLLLVATIQANNTGSNATLMYTSFKNDSLTLVLYDGGL